MKNIDHLFWNPANGSTTVMVRMVPDMVSPGAIILRQTRPLLSMFADYLNEKNETIRAESKSNY